MRRLSFYSPYQFALFRIVLGAYLVIHFIPLLWYGVEVYSSAGSLVNPTYNQTWGLFPSFLYLCDSPTVVTGSIGVMIILSLMYLFGIERRVAALLLWYGWASLICRNNFSSNPSVPYIGWILLASALIPEGEPLTLSRKTIKKEWEFPPILYWGFWLVLGVSYSISGFLKIPSPSWMDGSALLNSVEFSLSRDNFLVHAFLELPVSAQHFLSYLVLAGEFLFLFLCWFNLGRLVAWSTMVGMHIGILFMFGFPDLTLGVLIAHLFVFDARWIPGRSLDKPRLKLFFDGVCSLCNGVVDFVLAEDRGKAILLSPLQGTTAKELLSNHAHKDIDSLVLVDEGRFYFRSSAVLRAAIAIGGIWGLVRPLLLIPPFIRDAAYSVVAANRYKWFGKRDTCRLPTPEERERFLP